MNGPLGINQDNITFDFCQPENSETPLKNKPEHDVTSEFSFSEPIEASPSGKRIVKKSQKIMDAMETERILNKSPDLYSKFLERQNFLSPTADPVEPQEPEEVFVSGSQETEVVGTKLTETEVKLTETEVVDTELTETEVKLTETEVVDTELTETEVVDTEMPETEDTPKIQGSALVDDLLSKTPKRSSRSSRKPEASKEGAEVIVEPEAVILPPPTPFRTSRATEEAVKEAEAETAPTPRRTSRSAKQAQDPEVAPVPAPTPKRTSKTSKAVVVEAEQPQEPQVQDPEVTTVPAPTPRRTSRTSKAVVEAEQPQEPQVQDPEVTTVPAPTPRKTSRTSKAVVEAEKPQEPQVQDSEVAPVSAPTPRRTSKTAKAVVVEAEQSQEPQVQTPRRTSKSSKAVVVEAEQPQEPQGPTPRRTSKSSKAVVVEAQTEQVPNPRRTSRTSKAVDETEAAGVEVQDSTQEYPETEVTVSAVLAKTEGTPVKKRGRPPKAAKEGMHKSKVLSIRVGKIYEHPSVFLFPLTNLDF